MAWLAELIEFPWAAKTAHCFSNQARLNVLGSDVQRSCAILQHPMDVAKFPNCVGTGVPLCQYVARRLDGKVYERLVYAAANPPPHPLKQLFTLAYHMRDTEIGCCFTAWPRTA